MKKNTLLSTLFFISVSFLNGQSADISYGSEPSIGGSLFQGLDGDAVDSIAIGYFTGAANAELSGWNPFATSTTFQTLDGLSINTENSVDVSLGIGSDAWLLVSDDSFSGLIRSNDWDAITGASPPALESLIYQLGPSNTISSSSFLGDLAVFDNGGQGGSGLLVQVVPEPSTYALFAGILSIGYIIVRRSRARA